MNIRDVYISGFRSFQAGQTLELPLSGGFFHLIGQNTEFPSLGSNGCGKSSIWDAIVWGLFGKTARGLRASDIINWAQKDVTCVSVGFEREGVGYRLTRTQSPNSLRLQEGGAERTVTQVEIDALIGFDYEAFLRVVLMGQFNDYFFDLTPTVKLDIFSKALHLDFWMKSSEKAKVETGKIDSQIITAKQQISHLEGVINTNEKWMVELERLRVEFDNQTTDKIQQIEYEINHWKVQEIELTEHLDTCQTGLEDLRLRYSEDRNLLTTHQQELSDLRAEDRVVQSQLQSNQGTIRRLEDQIKQLHSKPGTCPTCNGPIDTTKFKKQAQELQGQLNVLNAAQADKQNHLKGVLEAIGATNEAIRKLMESPLANEITEWSKATDDAQRAVQDVKRKRAIAENTLDTLRAQSNPHTSQIEDLAKDLSAQRKEMEELRAGLEHLNVRAENHRYWIKGFKELRLWLIEEALGQLETEVNNCLPSLGLEGWSIQFEAERESAAGGIIKGFQVIIHPPHVSGDGIAWEAWSGGETQRLRIAGAIGLANLIKSRRGSSCNLEIWDEPTEYLSAEGVTNLLQFFEERARSTGLQVWLVDHHSLTYGGFDAEVLVEKVRSGSKLRVRDRGTWTTNMSRLRGQ